MLMLSSLLSMAVLASLSAYPHTGGPTDAPVEIQASVPNAAPKAPLASHVAPGKPRSNLVQMHDRTPDRTDLLFESYGKPPGMAFRTGYFGMPVVLRPYDTSDKEMQLISGGKLLTFEQEGQGFRLTSVRPLPKPPPDPVLQKIEDARPSEIWTKEALTQVAQVTGSDIGYQMGGDGSLFWVGSAALFKNSPEGWKSAFQFPPDFMARRRNTMPKTGIVVLPDNRIALFGGKEFFIQIIELKDTKDTDDKGEPKTIKAIGYDSFGFTTNNCPYQSGPQYCISGGYLYFHLRKTGHFYRLNLNSWTLTDYDVPWMTQEFTKPGEPLKWKGTHGSSNISQPVVPESMSFSIDWDGSVHVAALMFNMPVAVMHCFAASSEGSTIHSEIKTSSDLADPLTYQNSTGELVSIKSALDAFRSQRVDASPAESTATPTTAATPNKPASLKEEK
ncbi:MAG: hypothetical protein IPP78_04220 [Holophagaceae bacterium]|nr:hypothetical protein [Holophagaceae bacterium]